MKNDLPYFSHFNDARNHPKMKALRAQYGVAGYGLFWMLNEMIAASREARLDLSKKIYRTATAGELGMNLDEFDAFLAFLSDPEYDLVNYQDGILTTDQTQKDYSMVQGKREKNQQEYRSRKDSDAENEDSDAENNNPDCGNDTQHSTAHNITIEQQAAREGLPVDKSEEASLYEFALAEARRRRGVRTPEGLAHKLMGDEKIVHAWREATKPKPPPLPDPPDCECGGGAEYVVRFPGDPENVRRCQRCKRAVYWDDTWSTWLPLSEAKEFDNSA